MNSWLQLLATTFAWAVTFHIAKYAVALMPPLTAAIARFAIGACVLVPWLMVREGWDWRGLRRNWLALLFMGAVGIMGFNVGMFYGLQGSSAINAALIMACNPALTLLLSGLLGGERISRGSALGMALALLGVGFVVTRGSWAVLTGLSFSRGDLWLLAGSAAWSLYSVVPRRFVRDLGALQITTSTIVIGTLSMALAAWLWSPAALQAPPAAAWPALLFMGVIASACCYLWWNSCVLKLGPGRTAVFMNLVPVFTVAVGVALGQSLSAAQIVGAVLVIAGVLWATRASYASGTS